MALEHESDSPLALAVRKAGSQTAFGRIVGKRQSVIHDWLREGRQLPAELIDVVSAELDIPPRRLRPDLAHLFPEPTPPPPAVEQRAAGGTPSALEGVQS